MADKDRPREIRRQLNRRGTRSLYNFVVCSIDDQSDKKRAELLRDRIVGRRLGIANNINGIFVKQLENPPFVLEGPTMRDVRRATSSQPHAG